MKCKGRDRIGRRIYTHTYVRTHTQLAFHICWFCIHRLNQPWIKNMKKNLIKFWKITFEFVRCWQLFTYHLHCIQFSSIQSLSCVRLCNPMNGSIPGLPSITNSRSSLKLTSIKLVMPSSHLILCRPLFLLPPIPPSIRIFSNESILCMRWPKYWSFSFSIIPSKEIPGLISFRRDLLDLQPARW